MKSELKNTQKVVDTAENLCYYHVALEKERRRFARIYSFVRYKMAINEGKMLEVKSYVHYDAEGRSD